MCGRCLSHWQVHSVDDAQMVGGSSASKNSESELESMSVGGAGRSGYGMSSSHEEISLSEVKSISTRGGGRRWTYSSMTLRRASIAARLRACCSRLLLLNRFSAAIASSSAFCSALMRSRSMRRSRCSSQAMRRLRVFLYSASSARRTARRRLRRTPLGAFSERGMVEKDRGLQKCRE